MKILQEVIANLPEGTIKGIHLGEHWNAVVAQVDGRLNCGLASNPARFEASYRNVSAGLAERLQAQPARELCNLVFQKDLLLASVAVASMNALLPRRPESWVDCNAEQIIVQRGAGKRVAMIGHFPSVPLLRQQVGRLDVLELNPQPGDYPAEAAPEVIPQADVVAITGMTLINGTLEGLLKLCSPQAYVIMLGPSTLLSPVLFDYGVDLLGGSVVEKLDPVLQAVDEGISSQIFPLGVRMVIMSRDKIAA
jgi:uncharacterized protein (DUF4213/DUF364 family)